MTKILIDEATVKLVLEKIKAARDCHPKAVDTLLFEAEEILEEALADQPAPVHCEAGPEYCQQCRKEAFEDRSLALAAAVRYVKNNCPHLVWTEIERALNTPQPTQRTWVGLTYEEAKEIYTCIHGYDSSKRIAEAIEAKLRSKNDDRN